MSHVEDAKEGMFDKIDAPRRAVMKNVPFPLNWIVAAPVVAAEAVALVPSVFVAGLGGLVADGVDALRGKATPEWEQNIANISENSPEKPELSVYGMSSRDLRDDVQKFGGALKKNTTAKKMRFEGCSFDETSSQGIADALRQNTTLEELEFSNGGRYGNVEMAPIADALKENNTLSRLEIYDNGWGGLVKKDDARVLAEALKKNNTLTDLTLMCDHLDSEDAKALSEALRQNKTLSRLNLSYNDIGMEGGKALLNALRENTTLTELRLDGNDIPKEIEKEISAQLKFNRKLQEASRSRLEAIDARHMDLSVTQLKALAKLRREHPEVKVLLSEVDKKEVSALIAARRQKKAQPVAPVKPKAQPKKSPSRSVPVPPKKKVKTPQLAKQKSAGNGRGLDDTLIKRQRMKEQQKKVIKHNWNEPVRW